MKDRNSKTPANSESTSNSDSANRRRLGRVVHDDRGCASVEWLDVPANQPRTVLEIEDTVRAQRRLKSLREKPGTKPPQDSFNPYQRAAGTPTAGGPRRDLRKLSKWIKTMREVEERKALDQADSKKPLEE